MAERDTQILRQQNRIQRLKLQEQYEDRLRAQHSNFCRRGSDYYNDPYYYTAPNYRYVRGSQYYQTNQYGIRKLEEALQAGYNEGYRAGRADREDRWRYDYRSAFAYGDPAMVTTVASSPKMNTTIISAKNFSADITTATTAVRGLAGKKTTATSLTA